MTDREILQRVVNVVALRHQLEGSEQEIAARREDILECVAKILTDAHLTITVDAF